MGVYIKGMEMPKKCQYCPISHWNTLDIITGCELVDRYVSKTDKDFWDNDRPSWCPLIEIPEPHGRLGDLDELYNHLNEWYLTHEHGFSETEKIYIRAMLSGVKDSPTVIPASEEGE